LSFIHSIMDTTNNSTELLPADALAPYLAGIEAQLQPLSPIQQHQVWLAYIQQVFAQQASALPIDQIRTEIKLRIEAGLADLS
jgi:hypothetical protein